MRRDRTYVIVNIMVCVFTLFWFVRDYIIKQPVVFQGKVLPFVAFCIAVMLVHVIKALRLYFELYGTGIDFKIFAQTYCKVTPVTMIVPWKAGELFRMYCYGYCIGDLAKGVVVILLDRFMDTVALLTMIGLVWMFNGGKPLGIVFIFAVFLILLVFIYCAFPGVYVFWKMYLLRNRASKRTIWGLERLEDMYKLYEMVTDVVKGKGVVLYFCSLMAWLVEIGSIFIVSGITLSERINVSILQYLTSAVTGADVNNLKRFIVVSIIIQIMFYIVFHGVTLFVGRGK